LRLACAHSVRRLIFYVEKSMEYLPNGYTLEFAPGTFPLSTDSMLLSHFIRLPKNARVLDLGAGCGTLGLMLCANDPGCAVTGIEIDETAHQAAVDNIRRNDLYSRMESICADLRRIPEMIPSGSFDVIVSNPPYFSGGPASKATPIARRDDCCDIDALMASAAWAVKFGGYFYLVHKPERLAELITNAAAHNLEAKKLRLVRHKENSPVSMILLQFRKGAKPGLTLDEVFLFDRNGDPSETYREIYHI